MVDRAFRLAIFASAVFLATLPSHAQVNESRGVLFAQSVLHYSPGKDGPLPAPQSRDPTRALGPPDRIGAPSPSVSLGCNQGMLVVDMGRDIVASQATVYEIGPLVELVDVYVGGSGDQTWTYLGRTSGSVSRLPISPARRVGYVQLINRDRNGCDNATPGADIDAVSIE